MSQRRKKGDWWCPTCKFIIWESKPKCLKCGYVKPIKSKIDTTQSTNVILQTPTLSYWTSGDADPKWNRWGPYSYLKGGHYGQLLPGEPPDLKYPNCGCDHLMNCPKRHHNTNCRCYTCRGKTHKW